MKKILLLSLTLIALTGSAQNQPVDKRLAGLDTAFARIMKDWKAVGLSIAVVEKNKVIWTRGFGFRDAATRSPVTENTLFAIGSCTKAFTTSLLGQLQKDGLVDYDKPVRTYLPALRFYNDDMNNNITLRDMMSHRTGVARYDYSWYFFPSRSRDTLMARIKFMAPSEPLRKKWQYNNFMFLLQGMVTEKLSGKTWEENIREKIFIPAGMKNSNASLAEWMKAKDLAVGYGVMDDSIVQKLDYFDISGMAPAGSINSNAVDMAQWLKVWVNGGKLDGREILPAQFVQEAMSSQMVIGASLPGKRVTDVFLSNYGLGWMLSSYRGHYLVEHGGNIDGFSASTAFFPADSIGIVVMVNQNSSTVPELVRGLIADRMLGLPYRDRHTRSFNSYKESLASLKGKDKPVIDNRKAGTKPSHALSDYTGIYKAEGSESFSVTLQNDSLWMNAPAKKLWLRHYHYDVFDPWDRDDFAKNDSSNRESLKISFTMNEAGDISTASMPLEQPGPIIFRKQPKIGAVMKDSLQKYTGEYSLEGVIVRVYIKDENTLVVFVPGQTDYELVPEAKDKFTLKVAPTYSVVFALDAKDVVTELSFVQPNGIFKAKKIETPVK